MAPFRIFFFFFISFLGTIVVLLRSKFYKIKNLQHPPKFFSDFNSKLFTIFCTLILWVFGIKIKNKKIKVDPKKYPKLKFVDYDKPSIICSNHVSPFDILVYMSQGEMSFISKAAVKKIPFVGRLTELLGGVYVERGSHSQRSNVVDQIKERIEKIKQG